MTGALLYQPKYRWRAGLAFAAAVVIHFAAIAIAHVHSPERSEPSGFAKNLTEVFLDARHRPLSRNRTSPIPCLRRRKWINLSRKKNPAHRRFGGHPADPSCRS